MTYELAKQLKDAGFPQPVRSDNEPLPKGRWLMDVYESTLSELIEACGDQFLGLARADDGSEWKTFSLKLEGSYVVGQTPEEAVAKLWLALQSGVE